MNIKRRETRYFFSTQRVPEILVVVRKVLGREQYHCNPITETIYFTLGPEADYNFPKGLRIRGRRYIKKFTDKVIIDDSPMFLETKKEIRNGVNRKTRSETTGFKVFTTLNTSFDGPSKLVTYAATQSHRFHWNLEGGGRLTIDTDIRLFGFSIDNQLIAERICDFGEGKLEFKIKNKKDLITEKIIVENTGCSSRGYTYLERKTRQCIKNWIENVQN